MRLFSLSILVTVLALIAGCSGKTDNQKDKKMDSARKDDDHDHEDKGPHDGVIVHWGGAKHDYHPEFTVDHKTKKATVYILGPDAKKLKAIPSESITVTISNVKPPVQITLKADRQENDPEGKSSRFSGTHDALVTEMDFKGTISGKVGDKVYSGDFDEKDHEHKDHEHKKDK
jgi:hypothetical protein